MRMRKKKNLKPRMERCRHYLIREPELWRGEWHTLYSTASAVHLEIGCGKGRFTVEMAKRNPDVLFIAIERVADAIVVGMERAMAEDLANIYFLCADAKDLTRIFAPQEIDRIYLNFSDPWPGARHAKRRLTHHDYLSMYRDILKADGDIRVKTDNSELFNFTVDEFPQYGFALTEVTDDLHKDGIADVMTDYECKFYEQGKPIHRCIAKPVPWTGAESTRRIFTCVDQLIGYTPLLRLLRLEQACQLRASLLAKLENFNPTGSAKDRAALYMVNALEECGLLFPGGTLIEPTSGNTGIALASLSAARGYHCCLVMPEDASPERIRFMQAYGAEVVLTPADAGMEGAVARAEKLRDERPGSLIIGQFGNRMNEEAHYCTTGPEIWRDSDRRVNILVAGVGTGGTLIGAGRYLKEQSERVKVVAVEPADSPLLSGGTAAPHALQGIGANFVPPLFDRRIVDEIISVSTEDARRMAREMARHEGVLVGISAGAALAAAVELARREENAAKRIAVVLPDDGDRYLSGDLFT